MKSKSNKSEIVFAVFVGVILAFAFYWTLGEWFIPITFCGVDNGRECDIGVMVTISIAISITLATTLTAFRIRNILKK